jgi:hypothetical protein
VYHNISDVSEELSIVSSIRLEDTKAQVALERHEAQHLLFRHASLTWVSVLLQGKATGERAALWLRARLQSQLFQLGCFLHRHAGKVLFVAILVLATFSVGLKSAQVHTRVDQLWVEGKNDDNQQCMQHFNRMEETILKIKK